MKGFDSAGFADRVSFTVSQAMNRHRMLKQEELAERLSDLTKIEIKQSAISRWMTGSRPSFEHIVALCYLADVDPGWLPMGDLSEAPAPPAYLPPRAVRTTRDRKGPPPRGGGAAESA